MLSPIFVWINPGAIQLTLTPFGASSIANDFVIPWIEALLAEYKTFAYTEEIKTIGEPFIIYYSPRHSVNQGDAVFDVGIAIEGNAQAKDIIKTADLFEHGVLSGIHEGSIDNILDSYDTMVKVAQM